MVRAQANDFKLGLTFLFTNITLNMMLMHHLIFFLIYLLSVVVLLCVYV